MRWLGHRLFALRHPNGLPANHGGIVAQARFGELLDSLWRHPGSGQQSAFAHDRAGIIGSRGHRVSGLGAAELRRVVHRAGADPGRVVLA